MDSLGVEGADVEIGEGVTTVEEEDGEIEGLIREYQWNAVPDRSNLRLMEFYGGVEWRTSEGDDLKRCIRRILEIELVDSYQKNSRPSEEVRCELEEMVG